MSYFVRPMTSLSRIFFFIYVAQISSFHPFSTSKSRMTSRINSITPESRFEIYSKTSDTFQALLKRGTRACLLATSIAISLGVNTAVWAKEPENFDPIVQGILDLSEITGKPENGNSFLFQVYDHSVKDSPVLLAGARLPVRAESMVPPFRFQLFKENLLIPEQKWDEMGTFDQKVVVTLCQGPIEKGGICKGDTLGKGEGISKVVNLGSPGTEVRNIRLFCTVRLQSMGLQSK